MRTSLVLFISALSSLLLSGCISGDRPEFYLTHFDLKPPQIEDFEVCDAAGCRSKSNLGYTDDEWSDIAAVFQPPPQDAPSERERLQLAVALMEQINGAKNGTEHDNAKNDRSVVHGPQLDCIAEAANTTVALLLLEQEGFLKYHRVGYPQHRGFFQLRMPHNAASIFENETDSHFAMDSWFFKNGEPPVCIPVEVWRAGYDPED